MKIIKSIVDLFKKVAIEIPIDVENKLEKALAKEQKGSNAFFTLQTILKNIQLAKKNKLPLCQDTGTPMFFIKYGPKYRQKELKRKILEATKQATSIIPLRPNAVDIFTGKNTKNNIAEGIPVIYFEETDQNILEISLMLKGGGSENIGQTYKLPDPDLGAGRDLDGIRKCALDAVFKAQGKGCPPMIMSIAAGSPKDLLAVSGKKQLMRKLTKKNENPLLVKLEKKITDQANGLGIGPGGFGGKTTLLGTFVQLTGRHPASFFVDINFSCWAMRRGRMIIRDGKGKLEI